MALKRRRAGAWRRLKAGWKAGMGVAVTETGLASPFLTNLDGTGLWVFGAVVALSSILAAYLHGKQKHIPPLIVEEMSKENHYLLRLCSAGNLSLACDATERLFGRDAVAFETLEQWRKRCPKGFVELVNNDNEFCGCFILLPLMDSFTDEFLAGRLTEHQICPDALNVDHDFRKLKRIYICGIMVADSDTMLGHKRTAVLISAIIKYIRKIFGEGKRTFFAVPVTREGAKLLHSLGFAITQSSNQRQDKHDLYSMDVSAKSFRELRAHLGDYSEIVEVDV